jgi:CheY-like chemotaxis protein
LEQKVILVVEDNPVNMELVVDLLDSYGYQVLKAINGNEAIQIARDRCPDLILMDIQLPGMSGLTATKILKQDDATKNIPVVALTAFAMGADELKAREAGCCGFITKPINTRELPRQVSEFLSVD